MIWDGYVSRWEFLHDRCRSKTVLHLGAVGNGHVFRQGAPQSSRLSLHQYLRTSASWLVGIDQDREAIQALGAMGINDILWGDAEKLSEIELTNVFEVVVCGHLIHYLSNPGLMLDGIKPFMTSESELILSVPNAFGLVRFLRYSANRLHEEPGWVLAFSRSTVTQLLKNHHYTVSEIYTCHDRFARPDRNRLQYALGIPFLRTFPKFGGSLLVVAKLAKPVSSPNNVSSKPRG